MTTLFISDLHLQQVNDKMTTCFCNFIQTRAKDANALYILGDLFEYWLGDDDQTPLSELVAQQLEWLHKTHHVAIFFMHGNRDFALGKGYAARCHMQLLPDPHIILVNQQRVLLTHGDLLCRDDKGYLRYRAIIRNPVVIRTLLALPLRYRQRLAARLRNVSQQKTQQKQAYIMDVSPNAVIDLMQRNEVTTLIHGHTHRGNVHKLHINSQPAQRIVLDAWHQQGNVLLCEADGTMRLDYFS